MYRHGFGDCFLLSFFHGKKRVFTMLIDCGIKHGTKSEEVPIEAVIDDLKTTLTPSGGNKPKLDVLVATHEHWDHISFFHPEKFPGLFSDFDIGQVWLAWTEDPKDDEAVAINSRLREGVAALQVAAAGLKEAEVEEAARFSGHYFGKPVAAAREQFNTSMADVLGFYGVAAKNKVSESGIKYKPNGKVSVETEVAMSHIVSLGENGGGVRYFSPGSTVDRRLLPPGVNVYVLGPPRGSLINKSNPSGGKAHETYMSIDDSGLRSFVDGLLQLGASQTASATNDPPHVCQNTGPFSSGVGTSSGVGMSVGEAQNHPWLNQTYYAPAEKYRQIDHCWMDVAGQFALQLDGAINNTSLVLAIELVESGKVLLFPGDAQVGSWLSWHEHKWKVKRGSKTETVTAEELLNNTVLYKVSHHGSHNATIKEKGLEMMTHPELVAMIPEKEKSYKGILYQPLMKRLNEICKGRVIVSADVKHPPDKLLTKRPDGLTVAEWKEFKKDIDVQTLFVEYTVH
jgi:beta-lactamase superfamily II metal-dependent hydrolase